MEIIKIIIYEDYIKVHITITIFKNLPNFTFILLFLYFKVYLIYFQYSDLFSVHSFIMAHTVLLLAFGIYCFLVSIP